MNNDYCLNNDDAKAGADKDTRYWYQKMWIHINPQGSTRSYAMLIVCIILFIFIAIVIIFVLDGTKNFIKNYYNSKGSNTLISMYSTWIECFNKKVRCEFCKKELNKRYSRSHIKKQHLQSYAQSYTQGHGQGSAQSYAQGLQYEQSINIKDSFKCATKDAAGATAELLRKLSPTPMMMIMVYYSIIVH